MSVLSFALAVQLAATAAAALLALILFRLFNDPMRHLKGPWFNKIFDADPLFILGMANGNVHRRLAYMTTAFGNARVLRFGYREALCLDPEFLAGKNKPVGWEEPRKADTMQFFSNAFGESVLSTSNNVWHKKRRRTLAHSFSISNVRSMYYIIEEFGLKRMVGKLDQSIGAAPTSAQSKKKAMINLTEFIVAVAGDVIASVGFSQDFNMIENSSHPLPASIQVVIDHLLPLSTLPFLSLPIFAPLLSKYHNAREEVLKRAMAVVKERRADLANGGKFHDLLQSLIESTDPETGDKLNDEEIAPEIVTFILAGTDTTAITVSWMIHLYMQNPDKAKKVAAEIDAASPEPGQIPPYDAIKDLPYLNAFISETMRMYPPAPIISSRYMEKDTEVGGEVLPRGTTLWMPVYAMHHNPQYWYKPEEFIPERFLPNSHEAALSPMQDLAYMPFSSGNRNCLGRNLALMELRGFAAMLFRLYSFEPAGPPVEATVQTALQPKGGLMAYVSRRKD